MATRVFLDNWTLQTVDSVFRRGLSHEHSAALSIDISSDSHSLETIPEAAVEVEALLSFLVNLVLRDTLLVPDQFTYVSDHPDNCLSALHRGGTIQPYDIYARTPNLGALRETIVEIISVTASLKESAERNRTSWRLTSGGPAEPFTGRVVYSAAGLLARSYAQGAPYVGHPQRRSVIEQSRFGLVQRDALDEMHNIIDSARVKLFAHRARSTQVTCASFLLPPIAIEIIEHATSADELIPIALQLRAEYEPLRRWLSSYQSALELENIEDLVAHRRKLEVAAREIESSWTPEASGATGVSLNLGIVNVPIPRRILQPLTRMQRFGVQALLNRLSFRGSGVNTLRRLFALFGETKTSLEIDTLHALAKRTCVHYDQSSQCQNKIVQ